MDIPAHLKNKNRIIRAWRAGVERVSGKRVTAEAIGMDGLESISRLLAVGKAASAMCLGTLPVLAPAARVLVVTKYGLTDPAIMNDARITVIESGHPLPDENSLAAGAEMEKFVSSVPTEGELVMLVSGGASSLGESLPPDFDLKRLQALTSRLLADGYNITQMNAARTCLSRIKGGKLIARFSGSAVRVYAISDVPGDAIAAIGSGIGSQEPDSSAIQTLPEPLVSLIAATGYRDHSDALAPNFTYSQRIIGSNRVARDAAAETLVGQGIEIVANEENLHQDVYSAASDMAARLLTGPPGAYIWGGGAHRDSAAETGNGGEKPVPRIGAGKGNSALPGHPGRRRRH